jgi:sulfur-carrier protein
MLEEGTMPVTVRIPTPLRPLVSDAAQVEVSARTVREAIAEIENRHPGFGDRLLDDDGELRRFINVFVRDEDVRYQKGLDTEVADGDVVSIVPAVAGG